MQELQAFAATLRVGGAMICPLMARGGGRDPGERLCLRHPDSPLSVAARRGREVRLRLGRPSARSRSARLSELLRTVLPDSPRKSEAAGVLGGVTRGRGGEPHRKVARTVAVDSRDHGHRRASSHSSRSSPTTTSRTVWLSYGRDGAPWHPDHRPHPFEWFRERAVKLRPLRQRRRGRIEIIPMIDVMFFLLATFMLASLSLHSFPVNLPRGQAPLMRATKSVTITITQEGSDSDQSGWRLARHAGHGVATDS